MALLFPAGQQFGDLNLDPVGSGKLYVYANETTNTVSVYSDPELTASLSNPVVLDSAGRLTTNVYVSDGTSFTVKLDTSADALVWSRDDVWGIPEGTTGLIYTYTGGTQRTLQSRLEDGVSVKDFGAVGDGVADDSTAIQSAIDAVEGTDNILYFPPGVYACGSTLNINKAIHLLGAGRGADTALSNSANAQATTLKYTGSAGKFLNIISGTASNHLHNGSIVGINIDGNALATYGIHAQSCAHWTFDVSIRKCTTVGLQIDDSNGAQAGFNTAKVWFTYGSTAPVAGCHGVIIKGSSGNGEAPQNRIWVNGLIDDGDMLRLEGCDNCLGYHVASASQTGGTGVTLRMIANGSVESRNHVIFYLVGDVVVDDGHRGSRILHATSEGQSITIAAGGNLHYDVVDYVNSEVWQTHRYSITDSLNIPSTSMMVDGSVCTESLFASNKWKGPGFANSGTGVAWALIPAPVNWNDGNIVSVSIQYVSGGTSGGNSVWNVELHMIGEGTTVSTPSTNESFTDAVSSTNLALNNATFTLSSADAYTKGEPILLRLERQGADGSDTNTDTLYLVGVKLNYEAEGPDSSGSGPYDVSSV